MTAVRGEIALTLRLLKKVPVRGALATSNAVERVGLAPGYQRAVLMIIAIWEDSLRAAFLRRTSTLEYVDGKPLTIVCTARTGSSKAHNLDQDSRLMGKGPMGTCAHQLCSCNHHRQRCCALGAVCVEWRESLLGRAVQQHAG